MALSRLPVCSASDMSLLDMALLLDQLLFICTIFSIFSLSISAHTHHRLICTQAFWLLSFWLALAFSPALLLCTVKHLFEGSTTLPFFRLCLS